MSNVYKVSMYSPGGCLGRDFYVIVRADTKLLAEVAAMRKHPGWIGHMAEKQGCSDERPCTACYTDNGICDAGVPLADTKSTAHVDRSDKSEKTFTVDVKVDEALTAWVAEHTEKFKQGARNFCLSQAADSRADIDAIMQLIEERSCGWGAAHVVGQPNLQLAAKHEARAILVQCRELLLNRRAKS